MAQYQITYWQEIPTLVTAREGRRDRTSAELPQRFQSAIDEAAMRQGMIGGDDYMEQYRRSEWQERDGTPEQVAEQLVAELNSEYSPARIRQIVAQFGERKI